MFSMQLICGIHQSTHVSQPKRLTRNKWGTWYLTRTEWTLRASIKQKKKKHIQKPTNLRLGLSTHYFQQTHVCLLKWNFLHHLLRFLVSWSHDQAEIPLNATSEITDLKQVLLRRAARRRFYESPQKEQSISTFYNTESSHVIPVF